jgi:hypothetical protein
MTQTVPNANAPQAAVPASAAVAPTVAMPVATEFVAKGATKEEFCIEVVRALIAAGLVIATTSKPGKDGKGGGKPYLKFAMGTIPTRFGGLLMELDATQANRIATAAGVPLLMDFSVALLELTPKAAVQARINERRVQTITRDANRVANTSTSVLQDELNRRRVADGQEPIK